MIRWRSFLLAGALLLLLSCWGRGHALAQQGDAEDTARALAMFEEAARHYQRGEFGPAAELLRQAYALYRNPTLLYNLARTAEGLGDLSAAIDAYERYLEAAPDAPDRDMVVARVATLRELMAEREALLRERMRAIRQRDELAARVLEDEPASRGAWPWIVTGVGVAGLGTGTVLWVLALDGRDDADAEAEQREAFRLHSRARTMATWGTASLIGGGALAVVGLGWWLYGQLFEPYVEGFRGLALSVGPGTVGAEVAF